MVEGSKINGIYIRYCENGTINYETYYKNGDIHGPVLSYNRRNGQLTRQTSYSKGVQHGEAVSFYPIGEIKEFSIYYERSACF